MDIVTSERNVAINIINLTGRLDAFSVPSLRTAQDALLLEGKSYFVTDLRQVSFMDSAGLSALVSLLKRSRLAGGGVVLIPPTDPAAYRILSLTRFDQVFAMAETVEDAVRRLFS